jgi:hypothetical protein
MLWMTYVDQSRATINTRSEEISRGKRDDEDERTYKDTRVGSPLERLSDIYIHVVQNMHIYNNACGDLPLRSQRR